MLRPMEQEQEPGACRSGDVMSASTVPNPRLHESTKGPNPIFYFLMFICFKSI